MELRPKFEHSDHLKPTFSNVITVESDPKEPYHGSYVVDPRFDAQTLETKNKLMLNDIRVNEIKVVATPNDSGGDTIYIG